MYPRNNIFINTKSVFLLFITFKTFGTYLHHIHPIRVKWGGGGGGVDQIHFYNMIIYMLQDPRNILNERKLSYLDFYLGHTNIWRKYFRWSSPPPPPPHSLHLCDQDRLLFVQLTASGQSTLLCNIWFRWLILSLFFMQIKNTIQIVQFNLYANKCDPLKYLIHKCFQY